MNGEPWPLHAGELDAALAALESGRSFRGAFEELLLTLPLERAQALMLLHREGRGGWLPLAEATAGTVLCFGNAFSGTWVALARAGFVPTLVDTSAERLRFARLRIREAAGIEARCVLASALPFVDQAFDLAVVEPALNDDAASSPRELTRVGREAVLVADNRFGYKRSAGRRGRFVIAGPRELGRRLFAPRAGERTLAGHRRALGGSVRAFALYPHAQDWTHAVALDAPLPALRIGPKERKNRLKTLAHAAGLFPLLSPSFALFRAPHGPTRVERLLDELAERLGGERLELEELVATRGNNGALFVRRPGERFVLHLPLSLHQRRLVERHATALRDLAQRFPALPVPELLFAGELAGIWLTCERRLPGLSAPQLSGDRERVHRTFAQLARALATLVVEPPGILSYERFDELLSPKFDLATDPCGHEPTRRSLVRQRDEARERLVGRPLPLAFSHADLRSKHVQVDEQGGLEGILDWGSSEGLGLPCFDLVHFVLHEWKQAEEASPGAAWRRLLAGEDRDAPVHELLRQHALDMGVEPDVQRVLEEIHPVLVAATAERTWDYSRPRWLHRAYEPSAIAPGASPPHASRPRSGR